MVKHDIDIACECIRNLFPRSKWVDGEWAHLMELMERIPINGVQAQAAISQYKSDCRWATPMAVDLVKRLRNASGGARGGRFGQGNPLDWPEWMRWRCWMATEDDQKHGSPAFGAGASMAETVAEWNRRMDLKYMSVYGSHAGWDDAGTGISPLSLAQ